MGFLDQFTQKHIHDVLKKTFSYSHDSNILLFVDKCDKKSTVLNVKCNDIEQKYVLVKIPKNVETSVDTKHFQNDSKLLHPVFTIENVNKECYGAFEWFHGMEYYISPEHNNAQCLKTILQNLAKHQALDLTNISVIKNESGYGLNDQAVTSLDPFKALDKATAKRSIENLQLAVENLFNNSNLLVRSIWLPSANNVYIRQDRQDSIFLTVPFKKIVPPVYDALLFIFSLSHEKFRQGHFHELILHYFHSLTESLQMLRSNTFNQITRGYREYQVKVLLPIVKFEIVASLLNWENSEGKSLLKSEMFTNLLRFLKYPLINQEDIDEATKSQIGSSDYDLLDFSLIPLSEKNGHLGEYFHLGIKIKVEGRDQELQLFAKFLITSTEAMERVLKGGPSKKEDYFYKTLIPLFADHGLESLLDFAPRCYLSRIDVLLILDDLSQQGYVGFKPNVVLNYEGLRAIVKQLAKFHACTIILEEILSKKSGKTVRLDEEYGEFLVETMLIYDDGHHLKQRYDATLEVMDHIVEKFPEITKRLDSSPQEIRSRLRNFFLSIFSKVKKSDTIRNVINHGDVVVANMLFKFDENNLISKGILVDFQMLRYVTPSYDLLVFLIANSTKETREKYLKQLIEQYYQYISDNIRKFNYDPEKVFSKKLFDEDINFMMSAAVMGAFMYAHILHIDPDFREEIAHDQEKFDYYFNKHRDELVDLSWKSEHYRNILKGLVQDIVDEIVKDF